MRGIIDEKEKCLKKLNEMQTFVPFLDFMIDKIKRNHVLPLECQLTKFQYIRSLIVEKNTRYSLEGLNNVEDVLQKLVIKLDQKGFIPKDSKEFPGVKVRSTSCTEVLTKTDYECDDVSNCSSPTTTNSNSNDFTSNINDSPSGTVDILVRSLRMSVGHDTRSDEINASNQVCCNDTNEVETTAKIGIAESDFAEIKESGDCNKVNDEVSIKSVGNSENSTASDVLKNSRKKLLKSVSGKGVATDNNGESDLKAAVRPDSSKDARSSVSESKRTKYNPTYKERTKEEKQGKGGSIKNDSLSSELSDISDEEYLVDEKSQLHTKDTSAVNGGVGKSIKVSVDNYGTNWDDVKTNDNFIVAPQSNSVFEFSNKQKLRERLSADIAEVHKVPGKSIGGSLRSLKDVKTPSHENDLAKLDRAAESHFSGVKKASWKERNDHRRRYHESKHGYPKKGSDIEDVKCGRKESSRGTDRREKYKHRRRKFYEKKKSNTGHSSRSSKSSSSESSSSKNKKVKQKKQSEIDKLNDYELAAFVKENISSFPNLSKLKPEELRRVARFSLSTEDLNFEEKFDLDCEESTGANTLSDQDISRKNVREKNKSDSSHSSPPHTNERRSEVDTDTNFEEETFEKDNTSVLNTEIRTEFDGSKALMEESVYSPGILLPSTQVESRKNMPLPEDFNSLECKDQRQKQAVAVAAENRYKTSDPRLQNWTQNTDLGPTESFIPPRFSSMYNDRNTSDSRSRNTNVCYETAYYSRPYFPGQGSNRFYTYEPATYDANSNVQRRYGMAGEATRFSGYNIGRNANFTVPEPKSYGEYKELKRQEMEIMNRFKLAHRDLPNSTEPSSSEEESPDKSKLTSSYFGSKCAEDGKGKHSAKPSGVAKEKDCRDAKAYRAKPIKSNSKYRSSFEEDKRVRDDKSPESRKSSVEDELVSPLDKLYDNNPKPVTGRGYGLQNFKIPKKDTNTFPKSQKSHSHDKEGQNKQRSFYKNKCDTDTTSSQVCSEEENKLFKKTSDRSASALKSSERKVTQEDEAEQSRISHKNTNDNEGDAKHKTAVNDLQNGDVDILTREEVMNKNISEDVVKSECADQSSLQPNEKDDNEEKIEAKMSEDTVVLEKSVITDVDVENLCDNIKGDKDGNDTILETPDAEVKTQKDFDTDNKTSIKEEITQELVEALIKKSFESGEGELLLAKAKLFTELATKLNSKKLKTIQKIINSESDSSSNSSDVSVTSERRRRKRKRKDSDLKKKSKKQKKKTSKKYIDSSSDETSKKSEKSDADMSPDRNDSSVFDVQLENVKKEPDSPDKNSKGSNRKTKLLEQVLSGSPTKDLDLGAITSQTSGDKDPEQKAKIKVKSKGKTELDRLHDDIRSMFIASGVVTATGQRMCRILRESGGKMNNLDLVKESAKMIEEEKLASRKTKKRNHTQTKGGKNKFSDQNARGDKCKNNKRLKGENVKPSGIGTEINAEYDARDVLKMANFQPRVVLQRIDLKKLCYAYRIGGFPESYARKRGMNVAKRIRSSRSLSMSREEEETALIRAGKVYLLRNVRKYLALKNSKHKKIYKPKKVSHVIENLKATKFRHFDFGGKDDSHKEVVFTPLRQLFDPNTEPNKKENILKRNDILNYAFERTKNVFFCLLCDHSTKAITDHYLLQHPASEVLISRLTVTEARKAVRNSEANKYNVTDYENDGKSQTLNPRIISKPTGAPPGYLCRMCNIGSIPSICQFYSHVSTHTGEYRFLCPVDGCSLPMADRESVKIHVNWKHQESKHQENNAVEAFPLPATSGILFGYLCSRCNFVQILRKNAESHVQNQHAGIENVKIIKIDLSRQIEKERPKRRRAKKRKRVHNENERVDAAEVSTENKDVAPKAQVDDEESSDDVSREESIPGSSNESKEASRSGSVEDLSKDTEGDQSGESGMAELDTLNVVDTEEQQSNFGTQAEDGSPADVENVTVEEATGADIVDLTSSNCLDYAVDVPIDEMEQVNCFEIMQIEDDVTVGNELVEEVVINMETEGPGIMIADEVADTTIEKCWEVGPLKALMFENEIILYMCTEVNCQFSTKAFDDLENHMSTSHNSETLNRICKTCKDFPNNKVDSLCDRADIKQILDHLELHIKTEAGEDAVKKTKPDDVVICEDEISGTTQRDEGETVTNGEKREEQQQQQQPPFPAKPLLRVRNFRGDRLSKPKYPDEDHCYTESPSAMNNAFDDGEKESSEPLFKIKDVRSLNPESQNQSSTTDTVFTSQNITVKKFPPNAEVVSGKPVLVRSCPSPKITILPENTLTIPIAQAKQAVELRHLKVVPPRTDMRSVVSKHRPIIPKPRIKILPPAALKSNRLVPVSKSVDTVVTSSPNKNLTLGPVIRKQSPGSGALVNDRTMCNTIGAATNVQKKNAVVTPPLISISRQYIRSPPKETSKSNSVSTKNQQLYSISFGGKNIKDAKVYEEMLKKKKICQLFKCMAVECSFTCNNDAIFTQHIGLHDAQQRIKGKKKPQSKIRKIYNWQQCAYCCEVLVQTGSALSQHILTEHGHCLYQCAYCFYRAIAGIYVAVHQSTVHEKLLRRKKKKVMYKCQPIPGANISKQFEKQIKPHTVRPYQCEICGFKFFVIRHFLDHLTKQHLAVTAYACHICKILCFKADRLIAHYKLHSYNLFQCSYCLHGADTQKEMLSHLCNFHFSQPPILYARIIDDAKNGNIFFDDMKIINLENAHSDPDCIVEEVGEEDEEFEVDSEGVQPLPISVDLSAIASELGINIEDGDTSSVGKVLMDMETDFSRLVPVETILPNAKFSSDSDVICEENSSFLIASDPKTGRSNKEEKEASVPIGQLPIEFLKLDSKVQSSATKAPTVSEHLASIAEGIEKLQQNNCQVIISTVSDKKSIDETPTRTMHKLPPTIPINRSGVNNVYQSKKNVTRKLENIPRQTKDGVPALLKRVGSSQRISSDCTQQKSVLLAYSAGDDNSNKKDATRLRAVQSVVGLKRQIPANNITEISAAKKARISSGPVSSIIARTSSKESQLTISDVRSLSTDKTALQPPIIRVEDFANDEKGNLVRKKECSSVETRKDSNDCDKGASSNNGSSNNCSEAPLSPEVIIIDLDSSENNADGDYMEVVDSGEVEPSKSNRSGDTEKNKLERGEDNDDDDRDIEEQDIYGDNNDDENDEEDRRDEDDEEDDQNDDDDEEEDEEEEEEEDVEIRKEMEQLRNQIESETDCLLVEVADQENDPLGCSEIPDISNTCFSTDGETMNSFNETSLSENVDNRKEGEESSEKNITEISEEVTESSEDGRNKTSSDESKEDGRVVGAQIRSGSRNRASQAQRKLKPNSPKGKELSGKELYLCGIANCNFAAENDKELKDHLCVCDFSRDSSILSCPHCSRQFKQNMSYLEHLKIHGEKKYSCGICNFSSTTEINVNRHMKQKHKCSQTKTLSNDSLKPGYFAVYPKNYKVEKQNEVTNVYSPGDEDKLPLQSIYQDNVKCSQCPYFTKVRSNMVRHLKIHIKSAETEGSIVVPKTAPTNPVPCLDAKERMFDKMANLAASSQLAHANKDKKDTLPPEEKAKLPQFVPEQMRYKCCSPDCNYLTVDDNMLKHHIKALHDEINVYSCPHCRESVHVEFRFAPLDKIGQHLKYHDSKLYKCCHCLYFHYQKYVVEKHILEKHPERRFFVYTIREPKVESASEEEHPSPVESVIKFWKCGLCEDFERPTRSDVLDHLAKVHNMKSKFKCKHCDMKSSQYSSFSSHFASKHPGVKVECVRSIIQVSRTCSEGSQCFANQDSSTEYFDTTPLWQRDAPRVRHIRGILIEEEEVKKKRTKKVGSNATNETSETNETCETNENAASSTFPLDSFYCPLCADKKKLFRTKSAEVFRNHLYQELNYQQYACTLCGKMFVDKKEYERHHLRFHPNKEQSFNRTKEDSEIQFWVQKVVLKQEMQLKERKRKMGSEAGVMQPQKKKKVTTEEDKAATEETSETPEQNKPENTRSSSNVESATTETVGGEISDVSKVARPAGAVQQEPVIGKRPDSKCERNEQKPYGTQELKWLCHYCKEYFQTEDEAVTHSKNNHADNPIKTMLVPEEETGEPIDDLWLIEYTQDPESDSESVASDGTPKKKSRRGSSYTCGYCMIEVTDQSSIVNHFETFHKSSHSMARVGMVGTIYYRCNVCLEKLLSFSSLNVHANESHPNMTLQFEIRKIYKYDTQGEDSETTRAALAKAKDGSYQCPRCPAISSSYLDCIDHFNEHYPRYTCGTCNIRYYTVREIEQHQSEAMHSKPYSMTIPSEKMLDEYKAGITIKKDGEWVPLLNNSRSEVTDEPPETRRQRPLTARKSTTQIPERRNNGDEASAAKSKNLTSN